jgi:hypothetical protein
MSAIALAAMQDELARLKSARDNKQSTVLLAEATVRKARDDLTRINRDIQELELAIGLVTAQQARQKENAA